jgi:hypothetical protein
MQQQDFGPKEVVVAVRRRHRRASSYLPRAGRMYTAARRRRVA